MLGRFIHTPLMSDEVAAKLSDQLHSQGTDFASSADCVNCVLKIASDTTVDGPRHPFLSRPHANYVQVELSPCCLGNSRKRDL